MNTTKLLAPIACAVSMLTLLAPAAYAAAAGQGMQQGDALRIEPVMTVRHSDDSADAMYLLGRHHQHANRLEDAAVAYRAALEKDERHLEARNALATVYFAQKNLISAVAEFKTVLQQQPELSHVRSNLGYAYVLEGKYAAAMPELVEAIMADPTNTHAFGNLTLVYERLSAMVKEGGTHRAAADASSASAAVAAPAVVPAAASVATAAAPAAAAADVPVAAPADGEATETAQAFRETPEMQALPVAQAIPRHAASPDAANADKLEYSLATISSKGGIAIEIANGTRDDAMADRIAEGLRKNGVNVARTTALAPYTQQRTVILYRDGYRKQALEVSSMFAVPPAVVNNTRTRDAGDRSTVRLVLGKRSVLASIRTTQTHTQLASAR
jgi:tetratricopeptide (TPR) repeat protein